MTGASSPAQSTTPLGQAKKTLDVAAIVGGVVGGVVFFVAIALAGALYYCRRRRNNPFGVVPFIQPGNELRNAGIKSNGRETTITEKSSRTREFPVTFPFSRSSLEKTHIAAGPFGTATIESQVGSSHPATVALQEQMSSLWEELEALRARSSSTASARSQSAIAPQSPITSSFQQELDALRAELIELRTRARLEEKQPRPSLYYIHSPEPVPQNSTFSEELASLRRELEDIRRQQLAFADSEPALPLDSPPQYTVNPGIMRIVNNYFSVSS